MLNISNDSNRLFFKNGAERSVYVLTSVVSLSLVIFAFLAETKVLPGVSSICAYSSLSLGLLSLIVLTVANMKRGSIKINEPKRIPVLRDVRQEAVNHVVSNLNPPEFNPPEWTQYDSEFALFDQIRDGITDPEVRRQFQEVTCRTDNSDFNVRKMQRNIIQTIFQRDGYLFQGFSIKVRKNRLAYCVNYWHGYRQTGTSIYGYSFKYCQFFFKGKGVTTADCKNLPDILKRENVDVNNIHNLASFLTKDAPFKLNHMGTFPKNFVKKIVTILNGGSEQLGYLQRPCPKVLLQPLDKSQPNPRWETSKFVELLCKNLGFNELVRIRGTCKVLYIASGNPSLAHIYLKRSYPIRTSEKHPIANALDPLKGLIELVEEGPNTTFLEIAEQMATGPTAFKEIPRRDFPSLQELQRNFESHFESLFVRGYFDDGLFFLMNIKDKTHQQMLGGIIIEKNKFVSEESYPHKQLDVNDIVSILDGNHQTYQLV